MQYYTNSTKKGFAGNIWMLVPIALAVIVFGLVLTYGADITQDIHDDQTEDSYAYNASAETLDAQNTMAEKQGTIVNVIIAAVIIGILLAAFGGYSKMR